MDRGSFVVVPAYNEEPVIGDVLEEILSTLPDAQVVVVDDCSTDETYRVASLSPVILVRHAINLGQGAALKTGIECALQRGAEVIVTFDADGQMGASDIPKVVEPIVRGDRDVVLGTRFTGPRPDGMGMLRWVLLKAAVLFTRATVRLPVTDAHNGFRAFSRKSAEAMVLTQNRMAHASQILREISELGLRWTEVPVQIRYTDYSKRKGQRTVGAIDIVADLLWGSRR